MASDAKTVWVDAWQMQCCGDPFAVGDSVEWTLQQQADPEWLATVLPDPLARTVTHAEEHHGGLPDDWPNTRGQVLSIRAVFAEYRPTEHNPRELRPVPGSSVIRWVYRADGWEAEPEGLRFVGYVVELGGEPPSGPPLDEHPSTGVFADGRPMPTPEQASLGEIDNVPDKELPMLAAVWLADGWDSPELVKVASMTANDSLDARRAFPAVLDSIGFPIREERPPWEHTPWRGYWPTISWTVSMMDRKFTPYVTAQRIVEIAGDVPELWEPAGGQRLMELLRDWDERSDEREAIDAILRFQLRGLRADQVPPLSAPSES